MFGGVTLHMADAEAESEEASEGKNKKKRPSEDDDEEEEEEPEDPEVKALKEEISGLESTLKEKKSALQYALDQCEEYSKTG